jgi:SAM-dependent methyltransferase
MTISTIRKVKAKCIRLLHTSPIGDVLKSRKELDFWKSQKSLEGTLANGGYEYFFTEHFGLTKDFYRGKKVLDIGCGPRGSLEWAEGSKQRIGLDPLVPKYTELGITEHAMDYVAAHSERMPFPDGCFDVVTSINSLDHVANLERTIAEIVRVTATSGLFLLLTELNHLPTICEPMDFSFEVVDRFQPGLQVLEERRFERSGGGIYDTLRSDVRYDDSDPRPRYAVLSVKFTK